MKLFSLLIFIIEINVAVSKGFKEDIPHFKNSAELSHYVRDSIDKDLETLNLLDRAMAAPVKQKSKNARQLKAKPSAKRTANKTKQRELSLFGSGEEDEDNDQTNPMIEAISNMETKVDSEGSLISHS